MKTLTRQQKVPILMYHSISNAAGAKFRQFTVSPASFAEQMAYLHVHRYTTLTVTQYIQARSQGAAALPVRPVVVTFDDGFADFFTEALPVLRHYNLTATLYITTAFVDGLSSWMRREKEIARPMLSWQQVRHIAASGIECGAHTHTHPQLDILSLRSASHEMAHSKRLLEDHLGQAICSFAYPYGYLTARLRQTAREIGFTSACAVRHAQSSIHEDPFRLARLMVDRNTSLTSFAALLSDEQHALPAAHTLYLRARAPAWQFVRRGSAPVVRYFSGGMK